MDNKNKGSDINLLGLLKTFGTITFIAVCFGNLGLVPLWLLGMLGKGSLINWLPEPLMAGSIFIFFLCLAIVFTIAIQSVLFAEAQRD